MKLALQIIAEGRIRGGSVKDHDPRQAAGQKYYQAKLRNMQRFAELILKGKVEEAATLASDDDASQLLLKKA